MIGAVTLLLAAAGLVLTARAKVRPLGRHRLTLDTLALAPEWRFYAQASLTTAADFAHGIAGDQVQQSVGYLVMLRRALAALRGDDVAARQFGIVHAIGRGERALSLDFVSDWHCW